MSYIVTHLSDISQLAAQTDRLDALLAALVQQAEGLPGGVHRWASGSRGGGHGSRASTQQPEQPKSA